MLFFALAVGAAMGALGRLIVALVYNVMAGLMGGVKINLE